MSFDITQDQIKLGAKELRTTEGDEDIKKNLKKNPVYIIVDNVLDTYNTGSIFRLADAVAATKVYLCGVTETPPNTRIKKASINTTEWVEWSYFPTTLEAIQDLRQQFPRHSELVSESQETGSPIRSGMTKSGIQIVAVEQSDKSVPFEKAEYQFPLALIVSNESTGATQEVLDAADMIVEIPMWGVNKSLNVMVSLAIVLFQAMQKI